MVAPDRTRRDFAMEMRRRREERGVSLRQVADATKIGVILFFTLAARP